MKVATVGLGHMGMGMARNLAKAGHDVTAFDLSEAALQLAVETSLTVAPSGQQAVSDVDVAITVLPAGKHVLSAYRGEHGDDGLLGAARKNTLFMDCSTVGVDEGRQLAALCRDAGHRAIDAPVSGGMVGADNGTITFMIGGDETDFGFVAPLTGAMGRNAVYCGASGAGLAAKICNNMLLAINQAGAAEAFILGAKLGIAPNKLFEIISQSTGQSWSVTTNSPVPGTVASAPSSRNFQPGATSHIMMKDLGLAARAMEIACYRCEMGSAAAELYKKMAESKFAEQDFSGIINFLASLSGTNQQDGPVFSRNAL